MTSTLLGASIDGAVFAAIVWILTRIVQLSPSTRTLLWWCAAAKFVIALTWTTPIVLPLLPAESAPVREVAGVRPTAVEQAAPTDVWTRIATRVSSRVGPRIASRFAPPRRGDVGGAAAIARGSSSLVSGLAEWSSFAALGWICGLLLLAFVAVRRWSETASLVRGSTPASDEVNARALDLAARLRLRRVPAVRVSERIETPLVTGFVRPVILLPGDRFTALSERQREMALCHELAHLKRADLWLGCVPALAERLFFFHPLAHFVSREYSVAREAACDAAVVETLDAAPREYGCLLLALGVSRPQAGAAANAAWSFVHLKRRIAMLQELPSSPRRTRAAAAAAVAVAVLALVPLRLVARPSPAAPATAREPAAMAQHRPVAPDVSPDVAPDVTEVELAASGEPPEQQRQRGPQDLSFVLMADGQRTVAGSAQDLERARSFQRDGQALLWVKRNGREYVIRDEEVLRQAREAWREFNANELAQLVNEQVQSAVKLSLDSALIENAGKLGAEIGGAAIEIAAQALRNLDPSEADFGKLKELKELEGLKDLKELKQLEKLSELKHFESLKELDQLKHLHALENLHELHDMRGLEESMRELHKSLLDIDKDTQREINRSIREIEKEFDRHRDDLDEVKERLHDLAGPLADMGRHMGEMGREIGEYTQRAMEQMREVIDRAIASGVAKPVK